MGENLALIQQVYELVVSFVVNYSFQLAGALIILAVGFMVGSWVSRLLLRVQEKRNVDVTLRQFIASTARIVVIAMFVVIALSKLGISITPLIAAIGGLAVGASFAIQGPVSNYGAGLVIILTRMYKVGDTVTVQGCSGLVTHIDLAATHLRAEDGEDIIIPNKHVVGEIHRNSYANRLVEGSVAIDVDADPARAVDCIRKLLADSEDVRSEPAPLVGIEAFGDSAITIGYRYWVPTNEFHELTYRTNDAVYASLSAAGIELARRLRLQDRARD